MWNRISGKSSDTKDNPTSQSSRRNRDDIQPTKGRSGSVSGSIVSSKSSKKLSSRGDDRDRGFNPTSTSYSSTSRSPYPGTASASVASSYATASGRNDDNKPYVTPGLVRNASLADQMPKSRSSRSSREAGGDLESRTEREKTERKVEDLEEKDRSERKREKREKRDRRDKDTGFSRSDSGLGESNGMSRGPADSPDQVSSSSFSQFPGQYDGTIPGSSNALSDHPAMSSHVQDQFPGQFPTQTTEPYRPPVAASEGGPGLAAEYYGDAGQSVHEQPGFRKNSPFMIVNAEPHLQPASIEHKPPPEPSASGGVGAAASFFNGTFDEDESATSYNQHAPSTYSTAPSRPDNIHSSSMPAIPTVGGAAMGAAAGYFMESQAASHQQRPDNVQSSAGAQSDYSQNAHQHPPPEAQNLYHTNGVRPPEPGKSSSHSSNLPMYAAGAAGAAGLAAAAYQQSHHSTQHASSTPPHSYHAQDVTPMAQRHRHRGPFGAMIDFFQDPDGVAQYEEYSVITGTCKYCFEPGSSPRDAPRRHRYYKRRSNERLGSSARVDKDHRYYSPENESRRNKNKSWLATGLAGYGLEKVGETLFKQQNDFDDTYSVRIGRYSPEGRNKKPRRRSQLEERVETGITSDGTVYRKDYRGGSFGGPPTTIYSSRRTSRSRSQDRKSSLTEGALGATLGASVSSSIPKRRSNSPKGAFVRIGHEPRSRSSEKRSNSHRKKKEKSFFNFGGSSSSSSVDLGRGARSGRNKRSSSKINDDKEAEAALLGLGAATAALTATNNRQDHKQKRVKELVGRKETRENHDDRSTNGYRIPKVSSRSSEDEVWESAAEDDDESVDLGLAYGIPARRGSQESLSSQSSGTSKWGWRWGSKKERRGPRASENPSNHNSIPAVAGAVGAGLVGGSMISSDRRSDNERDSSTSVPLQRVFPVPTSDPGRFDVGHDDSIVPSSRPGVVPIQHPQPITPVSANLYSSQAPYEHSYSAPTGPTVFSQPLFQPRPIATDTRYSIPQYGIPGGFPRDSQEVRDEMSNVRLRRRDTSPARFGIDSIASAMTIPRQSAPKDDIPSGKAVTVPASSIGTPRRRSSTKDVSSAVRFAQTEEQEEQERRERRRKRKEEKQRREVEEQKQIDESRRGHDEYINRDPDTKIKREESTEKESGEPWAAPAAIAIVGAAIGTAALVERSKLDETRDERRERRRREREEEEAEEEEEKSRRRERRRRERERDRDANEAASEEGRQQIDDIPEVRQDVEQQDSHSEKEMSVWQEFASAKAATHENYVDFFTPIELRNRLSDQVNVTSADPDADVDVDRSPDIVPIGPKGFRDPDALPEFSKADTDDKIDLSKLRFPWQIPPRLRLLEPTPPSTRGSTPVIRPKEVGDDDVESIQSQPTSSRVTWGDDQTHEYTVITPHDEREEFVKSLNETSDEDGTNIPGAADDDKRSIKSELPEQPSNATMPRDDPVSYDDDVEFAATLAASAEDAGFDPSIVIDNPKYRRRDSPPGSNDRTMPGGFDDEEDEPRLSRKGRNRKEKAARSQHEDEPNGKDDQANVQVIDSQVNEAKPHDYSNEVMNDADYQRELGIKAKAKGSKKNRKDSKSKDDLFTAPESVSKIEDLETRDVYDSPTEDIQSVMSSAIASNNGKGNKKTRKKSKRDSVDYNDTPSTVTPRSMTEATNGKTKEKKKSNIWDRVLGKSTDSHPQEKSTEDTSAEIVAEEFAVSKKKKSKDRRSTREQIDDYDDYRSDSSAGKDNKQERHSNGSSPTRDPGMIAQDLSTKEQKSSPELMYDDDQRSESFLGERPEPPPPPDIEEEGKKPPGFEAVESMAALIHTPFISDDQSLESTDPQTSDPPQSPVALPSPTAVPFHRNRPRATPGSGRSLSQTPLSSAQMAADVIAQQKPRPRSTEFKSSREFRPLWLVETNMPRQEPAFGETYPSLPSSHSTSQASSVHGDEDDEPHGRGDYEGTEVSHESIAPMCELSLGNHDGHMAVDLLDSQQATPTAASFQQVPSLHESATELPLLPTSRASSPTTIPEEDTPRFSNNLRDATLGAVIGDTTAYGLHGLTQNDGHTREDVIPERDEQSRRVLNDMPLDLDIHQTLEGDRQNAKSSSLERYEPSAEIPDIADPGPHREQHKDSVSAYEDDHAPQTIEKGKKSKRKIGRFEQAGKRLSTLVPEDGSISTEPLSLCPEDVRQIQEEDAQGAVDSWFEPAISKKSKNKKNKVGKVGDSPELRDEDRGTNKTSEENANDIEKEQTRETSDLAQDVPRGQPVDDMTTAAENDDTDELQTYQAAPKPKEVSTESLLLRRQSKSKGKKSKKSRNDPSENEISSVASALMDVQLADPYPNEHGEEISQSRKDNLVSEVFKGNQAENPIEPSLDAEIPPLSVPLPLGDDSDLFEEQPEGPGAVAGDGRSLESRSDLQQLSELANRSEMSPFIRDQFDTSRELPTQSEQEQAEDLSEISGGRKGKKGKKAGKFKESLAEAKGPSYATGTEIPSSAGIIEVDGGSQGSNNVKDPSVHATQENFRVAEDESAASSSDLYGQEEKQMDSRDTSEPIAAVESGKEMKSNQIGLDTEGHENGDSLVNETAADSLQESIIVAEDEWASFGTKKKNKKGKKSKSTNMAVLPTNVRPGEDVDLPVDAFAATDKEQVRQVLTGHATEGVSEDASVTQGPDTHPITDESKDEGSKTTETPTRVASVEGEPEPALPDTIFQSKEEAHVKKPFEHQILKVPLGDTREAEGDKADFATAKINEKPKGKAVDSGTNSAEARSFEARDERTTAPDEDSPTATTMRSQAVMDTSNQEAPQTCISRALNDTLNTQPTDWDTPQGSVIGQPFEHPEDAHLPDGAFEKSLEPLEERHSTESDVYDAVEAKDAISTPTIATTDTASSIREMLKNVETTSSPFDSHDERTDVSAPRESILLGEPGPSVVEKPDWNSEMRDRTDRESKEQEAFAIDETEAIENSRTMEQEPVSAASAEQTATEKPVDEGNIAWAAPTKRKKPKKGKKSEVLSYDDSEATEPVMVSDTGKEAKGSVEESSLRSDLFKEAESNNVEDDEPIPGALKSSKKSKKNKKKASSFIDSLGNDKPVKASTSSVQSEPSADWEIGIHALEGATVFPAVEEEQADWAPRKKAKKGKKGRKSEVFSTEDLGDEEPSAQSTSVTEVKTSVEQRLQTDPPSHQEDNTNAPTSIDDTANRPDADWEPDPHVPNSKKGKQREQGALSLLEKPEEMSPAAPIMTGSKVKLGSESEVSPNQRDEAINIARGEESAPELQREEVEQERNAPEIINASQTQGDQIFDHENSNKSEVQSRSTSPVKGQTSALLESETSITRNYQTPIIATATIKEQSSGILDEEPELNWDGSKNEEDKKAEEIEVSATKDVANAESPATVTPYPEVETAAVQEPNLRDAKYQDEGKVPTASAQEQPGNVDVEEPKQDWDDAPKKRKKGKKGMKNQVLAYDDIESSEISATSTPPPEVETHLVQEPEAESTRDQDRGEHVNTIPQDIQPDWDAPKMKKNKQGRTGEDDQDLSYQDIEPEYLKTATTLAKKQPRVVPEPTTKDTCEFSSKKSKRDKKSKKGKRAQVFSFDDSENLVPEETSTPPIEEDEKAEIDPLSREQSQNHNENKSEGLSGIANSFGIINEDREIQLPEDYQPANTDTSHKNTSVEPAEIPGSVEAETVSVKVRELGDIPEDNLASKSTKDKKKLKKSNLSLLEEHDNDTPASERISGSESLREKNSDEAVPFGDGLIQRHEEEPNDRHLGMEQSREPEIPRSVAQTDHVDESAKQEALKASTNAFAPAKSEQLNEMEPISSETPIISEREENLPSKAYTDSVSAAPMSEVAEVSSTPFYFERDRAINEDVQGSQAVDIDSILDPVKDPNEYPPVNSKESKKNRKKGKRTKSSSWEDNDVEEKTEKLQEGPPAINNDSAEPYIDSMPQNMNERSTKDGIAKITEPAETVESGETPFETQRNEESVLEPMPPKETVGLDPLLLVDRDDDLAPLKRRKKDKRKRKEVRVVQDSFGEDTPTTTGTDTPQSFEEGKQGPTDVRLVDHSSPTKGLSTLGTEAEMLDDGKQQDNVRRISNEIRLQDPADSQEQETDLRSPIKEDQRDHSHEQLEYPEHYTEAAIQDSNPHTMPATDSASPITEVRMLDAQEQRQYDNEYAKELERQLNPLQDEERFDRHKQSEDTRGIPMPQQPSIDTIIPQPIMEPPYEEFHRPLAQAPALDDIIEESRSRSGSVPESPADRDDNLSPFNSTRKSKKGKKGRKQQQPIIWEDETAMPPFEEAIYTFSERDDAPSPYETGSPKRPVDLEEHIEHDPIKLTPSAERGPSLAHETAEDYFAIQSSKGAEEGIGMQDAKDNERSTSMEQSRTQSPRWDQHPGNVDHIYHEQPAIEVASGSIEPHLTVMPETSRFESIPTEEQPTDEYNYATSKKSKKDKRSKRRVFEDDFDSATPPSEEYAQQLTNPQTSIDEYRREQSASRTRSSQRDDAVQTPMREERSTSGSRSRKMEGTGAAAGIGIGALVSEGLSRRDSKTDDKRGKKSKKSRREVAFEEEPESTVPVHPSAPISSKRDLRTDYLETPPQSPRGHIHRTSLMEEPTSQDFQQPIDPTDYRDSAIHISDSPVMPEETTAPHYTRDSGYPDTEKSPTLKSEPQHHGMRGERDLRNLDSVDLEDNIIDGYNEKPTPSTHRAFSTDYETPRSPENFGYGNNEQDIIDDYDRDVERSEHRSSDPDEGLRVSVEADPSYDVSVSRPDERRRRSRRKSHNSDDSADSGFDVRRRRRLQAKADEPHEPSPVSSTTKERSSALFGSSPSAREEISDLRLEDQSSSRNLGVHDAPTWSFGHAHSPPEQTRDISETSRSPFDAERGNQVSTYEKLTGEREEPPQSLFGGPIKHDDEVMSGSMSPTYSDSRGRSRLNPILEDEHEKVSLQKKDKRGVSDVGSPEAGVKERRTRSPPVSESLSERDGTSHDARSHTRRIADEDRYPFDLERSRSRGIDQLSSRRSNTPNVPSLPTRSVEGERKDSNTSVQSDNSIHAIIRTPDQVRSASGQSFRSSGTPPLRRVDRSASGDLRGASKLSEAKARAIDSEAEPDINISLPSSSTYDPVTDKGKNRADMADVYEGYGNVRGQSPMSPTRPPSMRKRQSMQLLELETRLDQLVSENRLLQSQKSTAERSVQDQARDHSQQRHAYEEAIQEHKTFLSQKDSELNELRHVLEEWQGKVTHLTEANEELSSRDLDEDHQQRYRELEKEHEDLREQHSQLSSGMETMVAHEVSVALEGKNSELRQLRNELDNAKQQVRNLQQQLLASRASDDFVERDDDYFDGQCQALCQHVQQWVLRFSKFSDMKACYRASEVRDEKVVDRMENALLDGTDFDTYLQDRVKRRDVFMSVVMTMIWEFVFTRYLFGMDREQRQKLKNLEKTLQEVGPLPAVHKWRATTLTLLMKRHSFESQRETDTQAVIHEIYDTLSTFLPPPSHLVNQIQDSLRKVINAAVDLSIEMRTQRADYQMLPPLVPEYDTNGDLVGKVRFNALTMNERSGTTSSNEALEQQEAAVKIVLFPLVVRAEEDEEQIVVCPAQVLTVQSNKGKKSVRVLSAQGGRSEASFGGSEMEGGMI